MEYASKTEAINGADNTKIMTPLRVKQSILANSQSGGVVEEVDPIFKSSPAYNITEGDITNWNNNIGGIKEEADPVFTNSPAHTITQNDIDKWNSFSNNTSKLIFVEESDGSYTLRKAGQ